jgi:hypothetical protein
MCSRPLNHRTEYSLLVKFWIPREDEANQSLRDFKDSIPKEITKPLRAIMNNAQNTDVVSVPYLPGSNPGERTTSYPIG